MIKASKLLKASLLSTVIYMTVGCSEEQIVFSEHMGEKYMNICDIPENIDIFKSVLKNIMGEEITQNEVELLKKEFEIVLEKETYDIFFSETEKVRFILLEKQCVASDSVPYKLVIGVETDSLGNEVFKQFFVVYEKDVFLAEKRQFNFKNTLGGEKDYTEIISKQVLGFNRDQFDGYMKALGAVELEYLNRSDRTSYFYDIDPQTHIFSRMFTWDISMEITAEFDSKDTVKNIAVLNRVTSKTRKN